MCCFWIFLLFVFWAMISCCCGGGGGGGGGSSNSSRRSNSRRSKRYSRQEVEYDDYKNDDDYRNHPHIGPETKWSGNTGVDEFNQIR